MFTSQWIEVKMIISIHAPREGGDKRGTAKEEQEKISIHAPREGGDNSLK